MAFLSNQGLLPKMRLEQELKVSLASVIENQASALQRQRPRIYQDLLNYIINPFHFPLQQSSGASANTGKTLNVRPRLTSVPLYWQRLFLSNGQICSELVIMSWQSAMYIGYLNILPDTFGLFSPLCPKKAMAWVNELITETLDNIIGVTLLEADIGMVTTLVNPNLAAIFQHQGFREDPAGPEIVGLPLPARFYRVLVPGSLAVGDESAL